MYFYYIFFTYTNIAEEESSKMPTKCKGGSGGYRAGHKKEKRTRVVDRKAADKEARELSRAASAASAKVKATAADRAAKRAERAAARRKK